LFIHTKLWANRIRPQFFVDEPGGVEIGLAFGICFAARRAKEDTAPYFFSCSSFPLSLSRGGGPAHWLRGGV